MSQNELSNDVKKIQEEYKMIIQEFLNSYEEGGFLCGILLGLIAEVIKGIMLVAMGHVENDSELTREIILDIIISVNRKFVDMLATDLNDLTKKTGRH